jgi:hypothetical protein
MDAPSKAPFSAQEVALSDAQLRGTSKKLRFVDAGLPVIGCVGIREERGAQGIGIP